VLVLEVAWSETYPAITSYKVLFENGKTIWLASGIIYYYFDRIAEP
jgi:hypothetical protein